MSEPQQQTSRVFLNTFSPAQTPALIPFLNRALDGRRYRVSSVAADFTARVLDQPGFDPAGLILAWSDGAVGGSVWHPLPDDETAALAWIELAHPCRGLGYGAFLLNLTLHRMAQQGYLWVEAHFHSEESPEAYALLRRRDSQVDDHWVNLVKT